MRDIIVVMFIAGCVGSLINFLKGNEQSARKFWLSFLTGISASFLVPLFLNTIESNILNQVTGSEKTISDVFVFLGFCLLASISSEAFITSLNSKFLTQQANKKAEQANKKAEQANKKAEQANKEIERFNQQEIERNLRMAYNLVSNKDSNFIVINDILDMSEELIQQVPSNLKAIIVKALALVRLNRFQEAFNLMDEIINDETFETNDHRSKGRAFYNRACFRVLLDQYEDIEVNDDLEKAYQLFPQLEEYSKTDPDLDSFLNKNNK